MISEAVQSSVRHGISLPSVCADEAGNMLSTALLCPVILTLLNALVISRLPECMFIPTLAATDIKRRVTYHGYMQPQLHNAHRLILLLETGHKQGLVFLTDPISRM